MATELVSATLTDEKRIGLPRELGESLHIAPGDWLVVRPMLGGVFIAKSTDQPLVTVEQLLRYLVISLGREAEEKGLTNEEDLTPIIEDMQERVYRQRYG